MAALGDKIASTLIAQSVGVSCVGWSGSGLTVDFKGDGKISEEIFEKSCVRDADDAVARGDAITYPIMVKASEGGGGKGIRVVTKKSEMKAAYRQVSRPRHGGPNARLRAAPPVTQPYRRPEHGCARARRALARTDGRRMSKREELHAVG